MLGLQEERLLSTPMEAGVLMEVVPFLEKITPRWIGLLHMLQGKIANLSSNARSK